MLTRRPLNMNVKTLLWEWISSWHLALVLVGFLANYVSSELSLDEKLYHRQVTYEEVQQAANLIVVGFNQELRLQDISRASVLDNTAKFGISSTNLTIRNVVPLKAGRYDFLVVVLYKGSVLTATAVVDVLSQTGSACDEQSFGKCHHYCREGAQYNFGYDCSCDIGYILQPDHLNCFATGPYPELFISNYDQLLRRDLLGSSVSEFAKLSTEVKAYDYNFEKKLLYVLTISNGDSTIQEISLDPKRTFINIVHPFVGIAVTDIEVNWVDGDIYFTDSLSSIKKWNAVSNTTSDLVSSLENPRRLAFSSNASYLLWINGPSNETSVMLLDLDTKEKSTTYVSTIYNILDLSIDLFDNRIFLLTEEGALLSLRFSGLVTELFRFKGDKPIALDILGFHSYVLLADGNLVQINNQRPSEYSVLASTPNSTDITIYHPLKQANYPVERNCSICEGECITSNGYSKCVCGVGYVIATNGYSCYVDEALVFAASSFSPSIGGTISSLDLSGRHLYQLLDGIVDDEMPGLIYGMDFSAVDGVMYYGDRNKMSIWQVSVNRLSSLMDDRKMLLGNTSVYDMSYDWINGYLYWTDDVYQVLQRAHFSNFRHVESLYRGNQLGSVAVDPFNEHIYWIDGSRLLRSSLDNTDTLVLATAAQPLQALTVDYLSGKLYWTERSSQQILIKEATLEGDPVVKETASIPSDKFNSFRLAVVQDYIISTSNQDAGFAVISLRDSSVRYIGKKLYYGIAVISQLRKPSRSMYDCLVDKELCSYTCLVNDLFPHDCICPNGYGMEEDNSTCSRCPANRSGPRCLECVCENGGYCNLPDATCICPPAFTGVDCSQHVCEVPCDHGTCIGLNQCACDASYTGADCSQPICEMSCNQGTCVAPNVCLCDATFGGLDCTQRVCDSSFCLNDGQCIEDFNRILCRCKPNTIGPRCGFVIDEVVTDSAIFFERDVVVMITAPVAIFVSIVLILLLTIAGIIVYFRFRKRSRSHTCKVHEEAQHT